MKNFLISGIILLTALMFTSCNTDFDLNADYEDITIVYGILDQQDDTSYLKVNKAFLGEGDVLVMAKVQDSSIYKQDIGVSIEEYNGPNFIQSFHFDTTTITNKEDGTFYNPNQLIYFSPMVVNQDNTYELKLQIGEKVVSSATPVVKNFSITRPVAGLQKVNIKYGTTQSIEWNSAINGMRHEVKLRFNFGEIFVDNLNDTVERYIEWNLGVLWAKKDDVSENMKQTFSGDMFYTWIQAGVPYSDPAIEADIQARFSGYLDYVISVAAAELNTYMDINEPSNSVVQERPDYTNVDNGFGIFSSRFRKTRSIRLHPETVHNIQNLTPDLKFEY